jgi:hypothetical protein
MSMISSLLPSKKWPFEATGICYIWGKVLLDEIADPLELLKSLPIISDTHYNSKVFFDNIRKNNSAFQITYFGGRETRYGNIISTFKIQCQL